MTGYLKQYSPWLQLAAFIGITMGLLLISILGMALLLPILTGVSYFELSGMDFSNPPVLKAAKMAQIILSIGWFIIPSLVFGYLADSRPLQYLGLYCRSALPVWLLTVLIIFTCLPFIGLVADWNQQLHLPAGLQHLEKNLRQAEESAQRLTKAFLKMNSPADLWINLLMIAIIPAIGEELFFRGVLQRIFTAAFKSSGIAIVVTAIIFSALHGQFLGFFPRMLLGILLGGLYALSGNLKLSMLAHFINNGLQVVLVYLFQQRLTQYDVLKDTPTPWTAGLASAVLTIGLWFAFRKSILVNAASDRRQEQDEPDIYS